MPNLFAFLMERLAGEIRLKFPQIECSVIPPMKRYSTGLISVRVCAVGQSYNVVEIACEPAGVAVDHYMGDYFNLTAIYDYQEPCCFERVFSVIETAIAMGDGEISLGLPPG